MFSASNYSDNFITGKMCSSIHGSPNFVPHWLSRYFQDKQSILWNNSYIYIDVKLSLKPECLYYHNQYIYNSLRNEVGFYQEDVIIVVPIHSITTLVTSRKMSIHKTDYPMKAKILIYIGFHISVRGLNYL
jgi:hypothetical protein